MIRFTVGSRYYCRSLADHECVWRFTVTGRTTHTVTIVADADTDTDTQRRRVRDWQGVEQLDPFGRYSLAPVLSADHPEPGSATCTCGHADSEHEPDHDSGWPCLDHCTVAGCGCIDYSAEVTS